MISRKLDGKFGDTDLNNIIIIESVPLEDRVLLTDSSISKFTARKLAIMKPHTRVVG